jgi:hypothetical protein
MPSASQQPRVVDADELDVVARIVGARDEGVTV